MKKIVFLLAPVILMAGCATDPLEEFGDFTTRTDVNELTPQIRERSLDGAIYNEVVDGWMIPQPDPYTLENFQKAYDNLAAGKSTQTLSKAQTAEFTPSKKLSPTHYALKIYPKSEEEQWRVETMEDVRVAYIPFSYSRLTQQEIERLPQTKTKSVGTSAAASFTFAEKSPYTVTYDNFESTDGGPTGPVTVQLPILYTVWPASKPLPDDLEYVLDYEVFLPRAASQTKDAAALALLVSEALPSPPGIPQATRAPGDPIRIPQNLFGSVKDYDSELGVSVPLSMPVRCQSGSNIIDGYFDDSGNFTIELPQSSLPLFDFYQASLSFIYQDRYVRWKIVATEDSTVPLSTSETVVFERLPGSVSTDLYASPTILQKGNRQANEILRAAHYFFTKQTDFPTYSIPGGLKIVANANSGSFAGRFRGPDDYIDPPFIEIINNEESHGHVIGTTLHELGHFTHYWGTGLGSSDYYYQNTLRGLKESFSTYVGWYLGEAYYMSHGWSRPHANYYFPSGNITGNSWQDWVELRHKSIGITGKGEYMPLYTDMTDGYDQNLFYSPLTPIDLITGVSPSDIWDIVRTSTQWNTGPYQAQCRWKIEQLIGTDPDFDIWIDNFDYWYAQPRNVTD